MMQRLRSDLFSASSPRAWAKTR